MPSVQYDYDYYEYGNSRRGTRNVGPRVSNAQKKYPQNNSNLRNSQMNNAQKEAIRKKNRASIRAVMNDNLVTQNSASLNRVAQRRTTTSQNNYQTKRTQNVTKTTRTNTKKINNLDVPEMVSKKKIEKPKEMSLKNAEVVVNQKVKKQEKIKRKEKFVKNFALTICGLSILFLICYRSSAINESFKKVNRIKADLENVNTLNAQIESEIQTQTDLSNIETYAKYQLGMQKPKDSQIQKIVTEKEDKISTPVILEEENESFWDNLLNDFINILD